MSTKINWKNVGRLMWITFLEGCFAAVGTLGIIHVADLANLGAVQNVLVTVAGGGIAAVWSLTYNTVWRQYMTKSKPTLEECGLD